MSLRELLKDVALEDKAISQSAFRLVQGLVEAVEAIGVDKHMASLAYVHTELAEAQVKIEELEADRDYWKKAYLVEKEGWAKIKANAEIGRLVRGMRPHSRITRGGKCYWPELLDGCGTWQQARRTDRVAWRDPAEALRAIRRVKVAKDAKEDK